MKSKALIIVADFGGVKAYRLDFPAGHPPYPHLLETINFKEARERLQDIVSDAAGRFHAQVSQVAVSESGERIHLESELHKRFVRAATEAVVSLLKKNEPAGWGFAAASEINKSIMEGIGSPWPERLQKIVHQNLMNEPPAKLLSHFENSPLTKHPSSLEA